MKAAIYRQYGPPEVVQLEDVDRPIPKDNEILARVHATTVCATDSLVRRAQYFIFRLRSPAPPQKTWAPILPFSKNGSNPDSSEQSSAAGMRSLKSHRRTLTPIRGTKSEALSSSLMTLPILRDD